MNRSYNSKTLPGHFEMECGQKCRSRKHALELNAAVTRGTLKEIQAYFKLCNNAGVVTDTFHRSALHIAASCGKIDVVDWLLSGKKVDPSIKDDESWYTALHRSIFYGQLAVSRLLIQEVPDLTVRDREGLGPLDIIVKDRPDYVTFSLSDQSEVYSWGDNSNLTLGHSVEQRRPTPEPIDTLRKLQVVVKQVVLCKYHSVFLTMCGKVLTCGHGQGGRLGHNDEQSYLVPCVVEALVKENCVQIAAARDHTVFLTEGNNVYTCGLNDCHQLGQLPLVPKCLSPKLVNSKVWKGRKVTGIYAGRFHTVVTTSGSPDAIYTFGMNAGQLGHPKGDRYQMTPRLVASLNHPGFTLQRVACSDAAIVCMTTEGNIYVLHEYQCRKIANRWQETVKICVSGGHLDHHIDQDVLREYGGTKLTIALLSTNGMVFVWRDTSHTITRCQWAIRRQLYVQDISLSSQNIVFITEDGEGFIGHYSQRKSYGQSTKEKKGQELAPGDNFSSATLLDLLLKDDVEEFHVNRIPYIYRATSVTTDRKGSNYVITQTLPNASLIDVPSVSPSTMTSDLDVLFEEADEFDLIHDIILKVGQEVFPAHRYILAYRSEYFRKLLEQESQERVAEIRIDNDISPHLFRQLLLFIYTDTCDLLKIGSKFNMDIVQYEKSEHNGIFHFEHHVDVNGSAAFETLSSQKKGKKQKPKRKNGLNVTEMGDGPQKTEMSKTPVKLLQDLAKKYGVKSLAKRLESVKHCDGVIQSTGKSVTKPSIRFERKKFPSLYDVSICSEDGHTVHCHKCVVVARLEYFHSMMASGWIETSNTSSLSLPIPGDILETVLDFLYLGDSPDMRDCMNTERLCNVLVVADQLLITVLKEICEVSLVALVTLKNAADMLEFASMYNAAQLRSTCQQYICLNLAAILEARGLDSLSDEVINELTTYYRNMIPAMCRRQITPWDEGPDREYLSALAAEFPEENEDIPTGDPFKKKSKPKKKRNRQRSLTEDSDHISSALPKRPERQTSICSETSIKSEEEENELLNITHEEDEILSQDIVNNKSPSVVLQASVTNTGPWEVSPISPSQNGRDTTSLVTGSEFNIRSVVAHDQKETSEQKYKSATPKKSTKLSQKERKRLQASQTQKSLVIETSPVKTTTPGAWGDASGHGTSPSVAPWSNVNPVVKSFRDLMLEEKEVSKPVQIPERTRHVTSPIVSPNTPVTKNKFSWGLPMTAGNRPLPTSASSGAQPLSPSSPEDNPWLAKSPPSGAAAASISFSDIVQDERQRHDNMVKNIKKPLSLIQIEERAMQELLKHYKAADKLDERITVERVSTATATPVWDVNRK